jgi:hypothetical protein
MRLLLATVLLFAIGSMGRAQRPPAAEWHGLVRGNEQFGRRLLHEVHSAAPGRNTVIAPLSLSLTMAAIYSSADSSEIINEIGSTFGWGTARLNVPARMLLAGFVRAKRLPNVQPVFPPEEVWITNRILYRNQALGPRPVGPPAGRSRHCRPRSSRMARSISGCTSKRQAACDRQRARCDARGRARSRGWPEGTTC